MPKLKQTKALGALTALRFAYECGLRGGTVCEPIGDNSRYDFVIDNGTSLLRVQVKTATRDPKNSEVFSFNGTRKVPRGEKVVSIAYEKGEIDCLATCAADVWFFFKEPHLLKGKVQVRPKASREDYKWNFGKDDWSSLGLPSAVVPQNPAE